MVQGHLVNGSVGKIVGFETAREAAQSRHEIGTVDRENDITSIVLSAERPENHSKARLDPNIQWPLVQFTCGRRLLLMPESLRS